MDRGTVPVMGLSRRYMIGAGLASLVIAPARAQTGGDLPPQLAAETSGANLLTIGVEIDGKGPFQFVIDTGADRTVIADDVARQLGLASRDPVMVEGVVRTVQADTVHIAKLTVGAIQHENLQTPVLQRSLLQADGYLGLDVIDGFRVILDFRNNGLSITEPRRAQLVGWAPPSEIPISVGGSDGHLRSLSCMIDGVRAIAFVDTGAEISVGNSLLYSALVERDPIYVMRETIPLTGVTGGTVPGRVTTIKTVKLGGLTFQESRIAIADLQIFRLWEINDRPSLLIGMNWLRQFSKVSIDYARKELRFDLASRIKQPPAMRCTAPGTTDGDCRYFLGSPNTIPRPSVPT